VHRRRLAGSVRPQEPEDLTRRDGEVDRVDGQDPALELAREAFRLDPVSVAQGCRLAR
jgi:hypothetical protein